MSDAAEVVYKVLSGRHNAEYMKAVKTRIASKSNVEVVAWLEPMRLESLEKCTGAIVRSGVFTESEIANILKDSSVRKHARQIT